jgi:hypothetical protein
MEPSHAKHGVSPIEVGLCFILARSENPMAMHLYAKVMPKLIERSIKTEPSMRGAPDGLLDANPRACETLSKPHAARL